MFRHICHNDIMSSVGGLEQNTINDCDSTNSQSLVGESAAYRKTVESTTSMLPITAMIPSDSKPRVTFSDEQEKSASLPVTQKPKCENNNIPNEKCSDTPKAVATPPITTNGIDHTTKRNAPLLTRFVLNIY